LTVKNEDILRLPQEIQTCQNLCLLASTTGSSTLTSSTDILFLTKMQKRQTLRNGFALLENDITGSERAFGIADI
jgi:hypothetical protein